MNPNIRNVGFFTLLLKNGAKMGNRKQGQLSHSAIIKSGYNHDTFLQTGLVDFYAKVGDLKYARKVFDEMSQKDIVSCNVMISVLGKNGFVEDARGLFEWRRIRIVGIRWFRVILRWVMWSLLGFCLIGIRLRMMFHGMC